MPTPTETNTPVPMSSLEQSVIGLLDEMKVNYTKTNENGVITLVNNETGKDIMRNGRVEISIAVELAKKDCKPTELVPDFYGFMQEKDYDSFNEYLDKLFDDISDKDYRFFDNNAILYDILVDRDKQCWGVVNGDALLYRDETGMAQVIQTIHFTIDELDAYFLNR